MRQLPLPVRLRASSVFESFYGGPNAPVVTQLQRADADASPVLRPVATRVTWLFGPAGVGKTHLLQAVCAQAGQRGQTAAYLPLLEVAGGGAEQLTGCEDLAVTCLDDFQAVAGELAWERALFRLYTELEDRPGRLVIAATAAPAALPIALRDLASRLAVSTILRLQPLGDEEQVAALQLRAKQRGLEVSTEVAQFLQRRLPRDMLTMCGVLDAVDEASLATQRRVTINLAREVLERTVQRPGAR